MINAKNATLTAWLTPLLLIWSLLLWTSCLSLGFCWNGILASSVYAVWFFLAGKTCLDTVSSSLRSVDLSGTCIYLWIFRTFLRYAVLFLDAVNCNILIRSGNYNIRLRYPLVGDLVPPLIVTFLARTIFSGCRSYDLVFFSYCRLLT